MLNPNLDDDEKYHSSSPNSALHESCDASNEKIGTDKEIHAFRPRIIYCPMFVWGAVTTGKFIALFLRQLSPAFSDSMIGLTLSAQYAITACLAGWGGSLADASERKSARWGSGRVKVLRFAVLLGTLSFLGHELPQFVNFGYQNISQKDIESEANFPWDFELVWHVFMRSLMAVSLAISAPSMDGLSLAHLECVNGSSQSDFGIERMYGAIFWGLGSLTAGIGIDYFGFVFLHSLVIVSTLATYAAMEIYIWGLQRDTTGAFSTVQSSSQDGLSSPGNAPHKGGASTPKDARFLEENGESKSHSNKEISMKDLFLMICKTGYGTAIILFVFALAIGISVVDNLAFIYFDFLGSSNAMNGCTVVFTVLFELPLFYLAPNLLKIHGAGRLMLFAGAAYVIRVLGYTLVPVGHMGIVLLLETLHGISYANLKTGSVDFVSWVMPKGYEASGQGVLIFVNYMGVVVGLALGGWIQEVLGPRAMYACMGLIVTTAEIVLIVAENCCPIENPANTSSGDAKIVDEHAHLLGKAESARSGQCNE